MYKNYKIFHIIILCLISVSNNGKQRSNSCKEISGYQCAKKVVFDSPGLVDFAIVQVNSVFNLPDGQVMFFEEFE